MHQDVEGFLYPQVDAKACIDCGLCERVCPINANSEAKEPIKVYAAQNNDEAVRLQSSSGGVFTMLAEKVILEGGVVFGARFDSAWGVVHDYVERKEDIGVFRGSKYLQSIIGDAFQKAESFLRQGRKVLFSGTPCQIMGLRRYLRKEYENLISVDFICHGVPSPKVWQAYLSEECEKHAREGVAGKNTVSFAKVMPKVVGINFREKSCGWKKYSFFLHFTKALAAGEKNSVSHSTIFYNNPYMQVFLADLSLRPSCYACVAKSGRSGSDITIGDFWGIEQMKPEIDDDKGLSLMMIHNDKYLKECEHQVLCEVDYADAKRYNSAVEKSVSKPVCRDFFFQNFLKKDSFYYAYEASLSQNFFKRLRRLIYRKLGL